MGNDMEFMTKDYQTTCISRFYKLAFKGDLML